MKRSGPQDDKPEVAPQYKPGGLMPFLGPKALRELRVLLRLAAPIRRQVTRVHVSTDEDLDKAA
jgi:hypothetical protein